MKILVFQLNCLFLFFLLFISFTAGAQQSYEQQGDLKMRSGLYSEAIFLYKTARLPENSMNNAQVLERLENKIEDARRKERAKLIADKEKADEDRKFAEKMRDEALKAKDEALKSQKRAYDLSVQLFASKIEQAILDKEITKAMRLTSIGVNLIAPDQPYTILSKFIAAYDESNLMRAYFFPFPVAWETSSPNVSYENLLMSKKSNVFVLQLANYQNSPKNLIYHIKYTSKTKMIDSTKFDIQPIDSLEFDIQSVSISPNGHYISYSKPQEGFFFIRNYKDNIFTGRVDTFKLSQQHSTGIFGLAFSSSSNEIAARTIDSIHVWDVANQRPIFSFPRVKQSLINSSTNFSIFGNIIFDSEDHYIHVWNYSLKKATYQHKLDNATTIIDMTIHDQSKNLFVACADGKIRVWDYIRGIETNVLEVVSSKEKIKKINISSDGTTLAIGYNDGKVKLWNIAIGGRLSITPKIDLPKKDVSPNSVVGLNFLGNTDMICVTYNNGPAIIYDSKLEHFEQHIRKQSNIINSDEVSKNIIDEFNLYSLFMSDSIRFDRLMKSNDTVFIVGFIDYLLKKSNTYNIDQYYFQFNKLFQALPIQLHSNEKVRRHMYDFYYLWSEHQLIYKGNIKEAIKAIDMAKKYNSSSLAPKLIDAHLLLFRNEFSDALKLYLEKLTDEDNDYGEEIFTHFLRLAKQNIWKNDAKLRVVVEKLFRLLGKPILSDSILANNLLLYPLQTNQLNLNQLIEQCQATNHIKNIIKLYKIENEKREKLISILRDQKDYRALSFLLSVIVNAYQEMYSVHPTNADYKIKLAEAMGNASYYNLFNKQFEKSKQLAEEAYRLGNKNWMQTNLAHALLYLGEEQKAIELYKTLKDQMNDTRNNGERRLLRDELLDDIEQLVSKGIHHPKTLQVAELLLDRELTVLERKKYGENR